MTVESSSPPTEDEHYFHSPLNLNAVLVIVLDDQLPLAQLKAKHLSKMSNYEVLSLQDSVIKLKFFDKGEAQTLANEFKKLYPDLDVKINFDTLTHPGNIYVRGLVPEVTTQDLFEIFEPFGEITSCKVCFDEFGQSKGYGFVNFVNGDSADAAIEKLNGLLINGSRFYLNHHIAKKERIERLLFEKQNFTNLYVKNIPNSYDDERIKELFEKFGDIGSVFLPDVEATPANPEPKRFGFVNYRNHESAVEAILSLDNKELEEGVFLSVSRAQRRDERKSPLSIPPTVSMPPSLLPTLLPTPPMMVTPTVSAPHLHHFGMPAPITSPNPQTRASSFSSPSPGFQFSDPASGLPLPGPNQQQSNLYVKNLTHNITDEELKNIFSQFGSIISAKIMTLENGITSRGFGFVCFKTVQEASKAMTAMNGSVVDGEVLHVSFAQKNNKKQGKSQYKPNGDGQLNGGKEPGFQQPYYFNAQNGYTHGVPGIASPSFYYGIPPLQGSGSHHYTYLIPQGQRYNNNNNYRPQVRKRKQSASNVSLSPPDEPQSLKSSSCSSAGITTIDTVNELSEEIAKLDTKGKFEKLLKSFIEPSYVEFKKSNGNPQETESTNDITEYATSFLESLLKNYDFKYDEILNDLSNKELDLVSEFEKAVV